MAPLHLAALLKAKKRGIEIWPKIEKFSQKSAAAPQEMAKGPSLALGCDFGMKAEHLNSVCLLKT
jgi:hypothetical protein